MSLKHVHEKKIPYFCIFLHSETYLQDKMQGLQIDIISYALMRFGFYNYRSPSGVYFSNSCASPEALCTYKYCLTTHTRSCLKPSVDLKAKQ